MPHRISIIAVPDKFAKGVRKDSNEVSQKQKSADFEAAIAAAGYGKFQYLLLLAIIPVSWATSIDSSSVAMILPSAECDLQMTFVQKGVLNAIIYVGMISSGFLWAYIADVKGRRTVFLYGYIADSICNFLSGFSQNFWMLVSFKFLSGFIISGPHASIVAYTSEFYGKKERGRISLIVGFAITSGNIVSAVLAFIIIPQRWSIVLWDGAFVYNSWRLFLSVCGVPMLVGVICLFLFPESPKFLMSQGHTEEALKVFKIIYSINTGKSAEEYPIQYLENELPKEGNDNDYDGKIEKKAIFFTPHLNRILLVTAMQFGSMYTTNTIRMWQPQLFTILGNFDPVNHNLTEGHKSTFCDILDFFSAVDETPAAIEENVNCTNIVVSESVYVNTIIITAFGGILILLSSLLVNILKYKTLLYISYGISFICIVYLNWSPDTLLTLILTSVFIGLTNTTHNIIIAVTVIMFPTSLRAIAVSLVMSAGRIGSVIGNLVFPILLAQGCLAPIIQLACLILLCSIFTCFLPSTKKAK